MNDWQNNLDIKPGEIVILVRYDTFTEQISLQMTPCDEIRLRGLMSMALERLVKRMRESVGQPAILPANGPLPHARRP